MDFLMSFLQNLVPLVILSWALYTLFKWLSGFFKNNKYEDELRMKIVIKEDEKEDDYIAPQPQTTQVSAKLSPELYKRLNGYCDFKGLSKTYVINEAVAKYLDEIEAINPHIK